MNVRVREETTGEKHLWRAPARKERVLSEKQPRLRTLQMGGETERGRTKVRGGTTVGGSRILPNRDLRPGKTDWKRSLARNDVKTI